METFAHQAPEQLSHRLRGLFSGGRSLKIPTGDETHSDLELMSKTCELLIDYAAFNLDKEDAGSRIDPFDDPFVAAALLTDDGRLISAHRKESHHEPHAEALALIASLRDVREAAAEALANAIEAGYKEKIWLQSAGSLSRFVGYFKQAGELLRRSLKTDGRSPRLVLVSSLEPCRDFETQPGCAHLINAFQPDAVLYACEDTNARGQGAPLIKRRGIAILGNLAVARNVEVNRLYYSSVHHLGRLQSGFSEPTDRFGVRYVLIQLDRFQLAIREGPSATAGARRLGARTEGREDPVYLAPLEVQARSRHLDDVHLEKETVDPNRVMFINQFNPHFILSYFYEHLKATGRVPGVVVCSQDIENTSDYDATTEQALLEKLQGAGVRVYGNVLRRSDEYQLALGTISHWSSSFLTPNFLYLVVKKDSGYTAISGDAERILSELTALQPPRRITVYLEPPSTNAMLWLLRELIDRRVFEPGQMLSRASFGIIILPKDERQAAGAERDVGRFLLDHALGHRVTVHAQHTQGRAELSPQRYRREIIVGHIDPVYIGGDALKSILDAAAWRDREAAGLLLDAAARRDTMLYRELIAKNIPGEIEEAAWRKICSVFNAVSKFGVPHSDDAAFLREKLQSFSSALDEALRTHHSNPVYLDLTWRWLAAIHAASTTANELWSYVDRPHIKRYISTNPFLAKELLFYASRSNLPPQEAIIEMEFVLDFINGSLQKIGSAGRHNVLVRLARLSTLWSIEGIELIQSVVQTMISSLPDSAPECAQEMARCREIQAGGLRAVFIGREEEQPRRLASYLFLRTTKSGLARGKPRGLLSSLQREFEEVLKGGVHPNEEVRPWRGDKTRIARIVLSEVPVTEVSKYLMALASDEDETIRWAAIVLGMDVDDRLALLGEAPTRESMLATRTTAAKVVETALGGTYHYWLHREFLDAYLREHGDQNPVPTDARIQVLDIAPARELLFPSHMGRIHPEVSVPLMAVRKRFHRIALVLPPLALDGLKGEVPSRSSTPALSLGAIGSYLLSRGHDVAVVDFHRYPAMMEDCSKLLQNYDYIGINVVTSTFRTTRTLVSILRTALTKRCPIIVLGGHAPTLLYNVFIQDKTFQWDYLVLGAGEIALAQIVEGRLPASLAGTAGIIHRRARRTQPRSITFEDPEAWGRMPWVDRRLFTSPDGVAYEPMTSRNRAHREAHVVMSKGCDWHCSFCTEAVVRGSAGEIRRPALDVLGEVHHLIRHDFADRVHFIDDNLLPQIAASRPSNDGTLQWAQDFLGGLTRIRLEHGTFGWRGLMRLEDFLQYQAAIPDWYQRLRDSGCLMLAFGIESGNETRRKMLKGGSVSNQIVSRVVDELAKHGIFTKGYFFIGGLGETPKSAQETIDFATSSRFSLAYFALYKNFRDLVQQSFKEDVTPLQREETYMRFGLLNEDLYELIKECKTAEDAQRIFGLPYTPARLSEAKDILAVLMQDGFQFRDLFKYNDYHENINVANESLNVWKGRDVDIRTPFLQAVRRAYLEFYAREAFVSTYRALIVNGY